MSISIQAFRDKALEVAQNSPNGEDTLIQCDKESPGLTTREYQRLGVRTKDFKEQNRAVRQALVDALRAEFGGINLKTLPESLVKLLKVNDFSLDKNGNVTSTKPLTARRIIAITDALASLNDKERRAFDKLQADTQGRNIPTYDKIVMAREMSVQQNGEFGANSSIKHHFALIALDMASAVRKAKITIGGSGDPLARMEAFSKKIAKAVAPILRNIMKDTRACQADKTKQTETTRRYGIHDYGAEDRAAIAMALAKVLMASDPKIAETVAKIDRNALEAKKEEFSDAAIQLGYQTADKKHAVEVAQRKYDRAVENNAPNANDLKKNRDKTLAEADALGFESDDLWMQTVVFDSLAFVEDAAPNSQLHHNPAPADHSATFAPVESN